MVSIGVMVAVGVGCFFVGGFIGVTVMCVVIVGGADDERGANSDVEKGHEPEA